MQAIVIIIQLDGLESLNNLVFIIEKVKLNGKNASMVILCFVQDLQKICFWIYCNRKLYFILRPQYD